MSDFDKEAERERLREKYERDQEKRQATERMSDLLLKGATMTDAHCGDCGDPIFRYEGDEFCPTCQRVVDTDGSEAEVKEREDVIEHLMAIAEQRGTETKFISTDFEKGEQLYDAFGGVAGILRYSTGI